MTAIRRILDQPLHDLKSGTTVSFERTITAANIAEFASVSGDRNPLHTDDAFAHERGYPSVVAHGQLVAAPVSAMAGHLLPGEHALVIAVEFEFVAPVFAGDRLDYQGIVRHVSPGVGSISVDVVAKRGVDIVLRGKYLCKVLEAGTPADHRDPRAHPRSAGPGRG